MLALHFLFVGTTSFIVKSKALKAKRLQTHLILWVVNCFKEVDLFVRICRKFSPNLPEKLANSLKIIRLLCKDGYD